MTGLLLRLFVKNYKDTDSPQVRSACGKVAGLVGIVCNLLLCAGKFLIGTLSGALSIAADAVNNLSDAASSIITLLGFKLAEKPADDEHPFGHARLEYLSGLMVSALILIIGAMLLVSSVKKLFSPDPETVAVSAVLIIVLLLSIAGKLWLMLFYKKVGRHIKSASLEASSADSRNDVLSTAAVLLACVTGALIQRFTGHDVGGYIDGGMGVLVALFILVSGFGIAKDTISPLLGEPADPELVRSIRDDILAHDKVLGIHDLIVHDYGPGQRFATVHVEMDMRIPPLDAHDIIDNIEMDFRKNHHIELVIHYDPVVTDDAEANRIHAHMVQAARDIDPALSLHDFRMVRGQSHNNLIFDLAVPKQLRGKEKELHQRLLDALSDEPKKYYLVITYDEAAFNALPASAGSE